MTSKVRAEEINAFLTKAFGSERQNPRMEVTHVGDGEVTVRMPYDENMLRPGGVISGPTQMALADCAAYFAIFTRTGIEPYAVTSNLNINFLNACKAGNVLAHGKVLKIGKKLAVIEVDVREETMDEPASHSIVTYALPSKKMSDGN